MSHFSKPFTVLYFTTIPISAYAKFSRTNPPPDASAELFLRTISISGGTFPENAPDWRVYHVRRKALLANDDLLSHEPGDVFLICTQPGMEDLMDVEMPASLPVPLPGKLAHQFDNHEINAFTLAELRAAEEKVQKNALRNAPTLIDQSQHWDFSHVSGTVITHSTVSGNAFATFASDSGSADFATLATELAELRSAMRTQGSEVEHDEALANVAAAEKAAKQEDGASMMNKLRAAGVWAFDVATKIGTTVAAKALEHALKMPS